MSHAPSTMELSPQEARLVSRLRQVAPGPLRERVLGYVEKLVEFGIHPGCPEAAAGTFPCVSLYVVCEQCRTVTSALPAFKGSRQALRR
jgi:hypothetical protein